ncbi:MAG TPA: glycosyltransferase family 87 protein [Pyrinomonadaceae bacterium]
MDEKLVKRALACLFVLLYVPYLYQQGYQRAFQSPGDFPTLYWGAKLAFEEGRSPYAGGAFDEVARQENRRIFPYLYPPPSLLAFYPFSAVTYDAAKVRLLVTSHVCLLVILYLFFFRIAPFESPPGPRGLAAALMTVFVLNYYPVADNFAWGQINLIVLALVCFSWLALKRGGHALSVAVPLSLAVLLKTYPVLLLPLLVIRKRYAAAGAVVGLLALYALAAWAVLPTSVWGDWTRNVLPTGGYGLRPFNLFLPVEPWNHSINGFLLFVQDRTHTLLGVPAHWLTRPLTYLLAGAVAAATVGFSYFSARRGSGEKTLDLEVSLFLLMMFLVAPLSWEHHLVYALPAALFALDFLLRGRVRRPAVAAGVVAALLVLAWDFPRDEMFLIKGPLASANGIKFFAAFGLWVFLAKEARDGLRAGAGAAAEEGGA